MSDNERIIPVRRRRLVRGTVTFDVDANSPLTRTTLVPIATQESKLIDNPIVIFHHDIKGRPYDDGRWFEKHDISARVIGNHHHDPMMEVTITSQYPPDETIFFSWAVRPGLPYCGKSDQHWPIVLSGVLAPEYRNISEIRRTIVSSHLPEYPAISFRMMGDASGYSSGETAGDLPVAFSGIVKVQVERVDEDNNNDNDVTILQVNATMLEEGNWPMEGAIAWMIRAAPTSKEAKSFRGVFGCTALVFDSGSCLARTRVNAGMKLPTDPCFMAAPLDDTCIMGKEVLYSKVSLDWEYVDDYSFTLVGRRDVGEKEEEACTVLVDWEVTTSISGI